MTGSTAAVLASRTRQRREARIRENYDRIFASLINPDSAKFAARHPTRVIPDVPGIFGLSKGEVKKDTKEIDKCSTFAHTIEFTDEEELQKRIATTYRPPISNESTLFKKQQRLQQWSKMDDINIIQKEIETKRQQVNSFRNKLSHLEDIHDETMDTFEIARKYLTEMFTFLSTQSTTLRKELRKTIEKIIIECQVNLPSQYNPFAIHWMTIIQEFSQRLMKQKQLFKELSNLLQQYGGVGISNPTSATSNGNAVKTGACSIVLEIADLQSYPGFSSTLFPTEGSATTTAAITESSIEKKNNGNNSESMDVEKGVEDEEEEEEEGDELVKIFRSLQSAMARDEELIDDLDLFLQDITSSTATTSSTGTTPSNPTNTALQNNPVEDPLRLASQCLLESVAIQNSELLNPSAAGTQPQPVANEVHVKQEPSSSNDAPLVKEESEKKSKNASTAFSSLFPSTESNGTQRRKIEDSLNKYYQLLLNGLENPSNFTSSGNSGAANANLLNTRKKRNAPSKQNPATEAIRGRTTVRSRVERDIPLLFSPVSLFEDSYVGTVPIQTIYSNWRENCEPSVTGTDETLLDHWNKEYQVHSFLPSDIRVLEDDLMKSLQLQSAIAMSGCQVKKLQLSTEELEKFIVDANVALMKFENFYKQVVIEDYHERNRMKAALVQFGLQAANPNAAPNAGGNTGNTQQQQDLLAGMEGLESLFSGANAVNASNEMQNQHETNSVVGGEAAKAAVATAVPTAAEVPAPVKYKRGTYPRNKGNANNNSNATTNTATEDQTVPEAVTEITTATGATKRKQPTAAASTTPVVLLSQASDASVTNDSVGTNPTKRRRSSEK